MDSISKKFGPHTVIDKISLALYKGEVCSILGENGAGKTTLMNILSGMFPPDDGEILINGKPIEFTSPKHARAEGIRMIYQQPQLIDNLTVSDNIFIGNELYYKNSKLINKRLQHDKIQDLLEVLNFGVNPKKKIKELTIAQQKMVEIAKAMYFKAKIIILDEPTEAFTEREIDNLFRIVERLKKSGVCIVFISHKIEEIKKISDRLIILRNGKIIDTITSPEDIDSSLLVKEMAGEDFLNRYPKTRSPKGPVVLEVVDLTNKRKTVNNVTFELLQGEILGIGGLEGAGKSSLAKLIVGIEPKSNGKIYVNKTEEKLKNPHTALKRGIVYLGDDLNKNLFKDNDSYFNVTISCPKEVSRNFFLDKNKIVQMSEGYIRSLNIKVNDTKKPIKQLSTGNLQKIAIAKWLSARGSIFIMDEPSKALDIPSKVELYNIMNKLVKKGKSILFISSDVEELIGMCDRILIMYNGEIIKEINSSDANYVDILSYSSGGVEKE